MSRVPAKIDIWSRGEVASHLAELERIGQVKPCKHLMLQYGHASAFYPRCEKKWASRVPANNVPIDKTAYSGPSSYSWPSCPHDCPHFSQADNFLVSVSRDQFTQEQLAKADSMQPSRSPIVPDASNPIAKQANLPIPERVTLLWLFHHVPVGLWLSAVAFVAASFIAGIQASRLSLVRELFGLPAPLATTAVGPALAKPEPNPSLKGTAAGKPASAP